MSANKSKQPKIRTETLRAFDIKNTSIGEKVSGLEQKLREKLATSKTANDRCMILNQQESSPEKDLITKSDLNGKMIFCTMLRIKPGKEIKTIDELLLSKNEFAISELGVEKLSGSGVYNKHYYFGIMGNHLITNLNLETTIKALQTYLNWYLNDLYKITPTPSLETADLFINAKSITISDKGIKEVNKNSNMELFEDLRPIERIKKIAEKYVKRLLIDSPTTEEIDLSSLISAKIKINFNGPDDIKKKLAMLAKPMSDLDDLYVYEVNGKELKKDVKIVQTKEIKLELTEDGKINENMLKQAMEFFIHEIKTNT